MMNSQIEYQGARFYKCALQVNPHSYAQRYQPHAHALGEQEYNEKILEKCRSNDIKIVGLSDHGDVDSSESLRNVLEDGKITIFPGFEIASSEKIHLVCLYPENTDRSSLNAYLGQLMGDNFNQLEAEHTCPSSLSCHAIAKHILRDQKGFWYAAHATGTSGLLKLSGAGDNYRDLWKKEDLVIAVQIPGTVEDLDIEKDDLKKYRDIIENKNTDYKRKRKIVIINAKDIAKPEDLEHKSASCLIKMTEPTFSAFKQAFHDPESRIRLNHQIPDRQYSYIKSIEWQGAGFFENSAIAFSEHLNAAIGGRGTGKSTLIESIRYALGLSVSDTASKTLDSLRKKTLNNSQIILTVSSKAQQGNCYTISRRYNEAPVVQNDQGDVSHLSPKEILPNIELLGQNEILEIENSKEAKLSLVSNFLPDSGKFNDDMAEIKRKLAINRGKLIEASEEFERLDAAVSEENKLKELEMKFKSLGVADKLKNTELLEKEKTVQTKIKEQFNLIEEWITGYREVFDLMFLKDADIEKTPNKERISEARKILEGLQKSLGNLVEKASEELQKAKSSYQAIESIWQEKSGKIRDDLNEAIAKLPEQAGTTGKALGAEYTNIIGRLTLIEKQKQAHKKQKRIMNEIELERSTLLEEYRNSAFTHFTAMNDSVKKLNKGELKGKVRISIVRCGNINSLKKFLLKIDGIGESKIEWLNQDNVELDLVKWAQWMKEKNASAFMDEYKKDKLTQSTADKLIGLNLSRRLELEEIELKDQVSIELNTAHQDKDVHYVPLDDLSTGQKCTAILNLLLLSCDDPLIIDQPEDNLDNAFIAERIVQDLRQFKTNRQFLFATHNANIPVFGDAELIAVLDSSDDKKRVKIIGSIDKPEVGKQAAEILEGGEAAFNIRKEKYGF